jgi:carboxymethylenebutenolidase
VRLPRLPFPAAATRLAALVLVGSAILAVALPRPIEAQQQLPAGADDALERLNASPRHGEWVTVDAGNGDEIRAWMVFPERADPAPVVVVIHEIFGLTDWIRAVADQLAAEGYVAIAPDLLSGMGPGGGGTESVDQQGATALIRELARDDANRRIRAAGMHAAAHPAALDRIASIGFCWGGTASFHVAASWPELNAAVVYYGSSPDAPILERVHAPLLGLYAGDDARVNVTIDPARELLGAREHRFEVEMFDGSGHGFLRQQDGRDGANLRATEQAWPRTIGFLRDILGR